ncbi:uncharacterized protein LOC121376787 [Gigantopelta aegis]|uniref:uncharacterized protein LOC121376787 n=1 Tax=Gigantopelta aegis TaxID=1735272 RepID=UPI001B88D2D5|nr:uncharacterized protein LOC121376787 [Gigantopelta aegis]
MMETSSIHRVLVHVLVCLVMHVQHLNGHGRLLEPPGRGSLWRFGYPVAKNYDDNALNCGGFQVQWLKNNGRCGFCGDPYDGVHKHETGGVFASNLIPRTYSVGQIIDITIEVTANHGGYFEFHLCPKSVLSQDCFDKYPLLVVGEGYRYHIKSRKSPMTVNIQAQLPPKITCDHCVFQWKWNCGQSYGRDKVKGVYCKGCGMQEQFYNCADVTIEDHSVTPESYISDQQMVKNQISTSSFTKLDDKYKLYNLHQFIIRGTIQQKQYSRQKFHVQTTTTISPPIPQPEVFLLKESARVCQGALMFGRSLDDWCSVNCGAGFCPSTHYCIHDNWGSIFNCPGRIFCKAAACQVQTCPKYPTAQCIPYCYGCKAVWLLSGRFVNCRPT